MPQGLPQPAAGVQTGRFTHANRQEENVLYLFSSIPYAFAMTDCYEHLSPATTQDVADALAFALRFHGRKRVSSAYEYMAEITAARLCEHLRQSGFVILKKPPIAGSSPSLAET